MSCRELIVLGTSSQVPTRYRNHSGYLLQWDREGFLLDPGEGTQRQMVYANVAMSSITKILISHFHGDHCLGLAGVSQRISLDRVPHAIDIYYPASGQVYYDRLRHSSIYHDVAKIVDHPIVEEGIICENSEFVIETKKLDHLVETWGFRLQERNKRTMLPGKLAAAGISGPAIGQLQRRGSIDIEGRTFYLEDMSVPKSGQSFAYVTDTRVCSAAIDLARGVDLLLCESTYLSGEEAEAREHGHMTASQSATIARDAGAKKLVLTHFSQRYTDYRLFLKEAMAIFPDVTAARDSDRIPMPRRSGK